MKASLRLPGIALAVLFWGCDETPVTPSVAFQIGGYAMADGQTFPSGLPDTQPIPSETQTLVFYASVSAPAGSWQLAATAGGAFALAAGEASVTEAFEGGGASEDASTSATLAVPLTIVNATGIGTIHVTAGTASQDFTFAVVPGGVVVTGSVDADGETLAVGSGIPAGTRSLTFTAGVSTPAGSWTLMATADGALALGPQATPLPRTFQSDGLAPTRIEVPLVVSARSGTGVVHIVVGDSAPDFVFSIAPTSARINVCPAGSDGGCANVGSFGEQGASATDAGSAEPPTDGGDAAALCSRDLLLPGLPAGFQVGSNVLIQVQPSAAPTTPGAFWTASVAVSGSIVLASADAGETSSGSFVVPSTDASLPPPIVIPAQFVSPGSATVTASVGAGTPQSSTFNVGAPAVAIRRVRFVAHTGALAQDLVTVCCGVGSGSLTASLADNAATLATTTAAIATSDPALCTSDYPGQATFLWSGSRADQVWLFSFDGGAPVATIPVTMLGTDVHVIAQPLSCSWIAPDDDGGSASVSAAVLVQRTPLSCPGIVTDDAGLEVVANASFSLILPTGFTASAGSYSTDVNGIAYIALTAPPQAVAVDAAINVADVVTGVFSLNQDGGL